MSAIENDIWSTVLELKFACKQMLENQKYLIEFSADTNIPYQLIMNLSLLGTFLVCVCGRPRRFFALG